jgi:hypothetical protein
MQNDLPGPQLAAAYMFVPFAIEIRCLLDYMFSKTALDHFQFYQLYSYHIELYMARWNNHYYHRVKVFGNEVTIDNKAQGWLCSVIFLGLLIGPFVFFSELGGFVQINPVLDATIDVGFIVNKTISRFELITEGAEVEDTIIDYNSYGESGEDF